MPHFKAFGMMNFQYELRFCRKIHNKGTMSQWQIQVTFFKWADVTIQDVLLFVTLRYLELKGTSHIS